MLILDAPLLYREVMEKVTRERNRHNHRLEGSRNECRDDGVPFA